MKIVFRYLTLLVLFTDFALAGMLPTLFIVAQGSRWAGPGRYRGAVSASRKLLRVIAWMVRGKALYALALAAAQGLGWVRLPWLAVCPLVVLLLGWEVVLEVLRPWGRFVEERARGSAEGASGPHRAAGVALAAAGVTLAAEVTLFLSVLIPTLFMPD